MKLSKYIVISKLNDVTHLFFSTISRSLIMLDDEKYSALQENPVNLSKFKDDEIEFLTEKHFIVEENCNEIEYVWFQLSRDRISPKTFSTYIALSTACNFSCVYCYEKGQVDDYAMDNETLEQTIAWYRDKLVKNHYSECKITLYGGEPLLPQDMLILFTTRMQKISSELGVRLRFNMITNGYLLEDNLCQDLLKNGLSEIQVTLDGNQEIHDRRRKLKDGGPTFDKIISNLKSIATKNITIVIRVSFDLSNSNEIKSLLDYLVEENLHQKIILYFAPIHQTRTQKQSGCSFCSQYVYEDDKVIAKTLCDLYSQCYQLGFKIPTYISNGPCMVVGADALLVAPNGDLYKCVEMIGMKGLKVGNVFDHNYSSQYYSFMMGTTMHKCIKSGCIYAPLCSGGCAMESYIKNGKMSENICHKQIFDIVIPHLNKLKELQRRNHDDD